MDERSRYSMVIRCSHDDDAFVVILPEWSDRVLNPVTHGETYDEAVRNGAEALAALIAPASKHGEPLPEPSGLGHVA